jgi:hypothetical protein
LNDEYWAKEAITDIRDKYRKKPVEVDPVNSPPHYQGGIECIEYIRQVLGEDGFRAYCLGNVIKYTHRHEYKGKPVEDLKKAQYYLNSAISTLEK